MDDELYELHLAIARMSGKEKACGKKINYKREETAERVAVKMSIKFESKMEAYPCPFCGGWHIGSSMNVGKLADYVQSIHYRRD